MTDAPDKPLKPTTVPVDRQVYFAAERTLLAWVRTGLAMMGFGFVVARFGLFLREMAAARVAPAAASPGMSLWIGTALVILGVVVCLCAAGAHWRTIRRLERGDPLRVTPFSLGMMVSLFLALIGVGITVYLVFGLHPAALPGSS